MKKFFLLGIREEYPQYLKNKLRVSNVLYIIVFVLAVGYSGMIALRMPELRFIPAFGLAGMLIAIGANYIGLHKLYRILLCVMPVSTIFCYHIGVAPDGNPALPSSVAMILAFSVFPFVVFDVREIGALSFSVAISYFMLVSFKWTNGWFETGIDEEAIRMGVIQEV